MKIGIIGAGHMGYTLATTWAGAGHEIMLSARNAEALDDVVERVGHGAKSGTMVDTLASSDVVLVVVPFAAWADLADVLNRYVGGKVVIDATNIFGKPDGGITAQALSHAAGSSAFIQALLPAARVVKTFNMLNYKILQDLAGEGLGMAIAADDAGASTLSADLVRAAGFEPVSVGPIAHGRMFEPGTPVYNIPQGASALGAQLGIAQ